MVACWRAFTENFWNEIDCYKAVIWRTVYKKMKRWRWWRWIEALYIAAVRANSTCRGVWKCFGFPLSQFVAHNFDYAHWPDGGKEWEFTGTMLFRSTAGNREKVANFLLRPTQPPISIEWKWSVAYLVWEWYSRCLWHICIIKWFTIQLLFHTVTIFLTCD